MRIDIGNSIFYKSDFSDNTLPKLSEAYESVYSITGKGQFIESAFKFDSEKILFRIMINGEIVLDIDVKELKSFCKYNEESGPYQSSVLYDQENKLLIVKFPMPVQYSGGMEFLAKTNDGNKTKKLKGYQVILNREVA